MVLINSLLECNSGDLVIKRIMRTLPLATLKNNISLIYKRYTEQYGNTYAIESLGHYLQEPQQKAQFQLPYFQLISETGFYIFFLICYYIELPRILLKTQQYFIFKIKKQKNIHKYIKRMNYFQQSLIGQMWEFFNELFKVFYNYAKEMLIKNNKKTECIETMDEVINKYFKEALKFFKTNSASIEIIKNDQIQKVRFIKLPYTHYLDKDQKTLFQNKVKRFSIYTKLQGLIDRYKNIIIKCQHEEKIALFFKNNTFFSIFANYVNLWRDVAFILTIILNVFILFSYSENNFSEKQAQSEEKLKQQLYFNRIYNPNLKLGLTKIVTIKKTQQIFYYLGGIMIFCSLFVEIFYIIKKGPLYMKQAWSSYKIYLEAKSNIFIKLIKYTLIILLSLIRVIINPEIFYYALYGILAFAATFIHPFFFSFHLTEIIIRYSSLQKILKSVYESYKQLILTFFLILLFIYYSTLFAFIVFNDSFDERCKDLHLCFFQCFDAAYKDLGGLGSYLESVKPKIGPSIRNIYINLYIQYKQKDNSYEFSRLVFETTCYISLTIILLRVIYAIIVDRFSNIRAKEKKKLSIFKKYVLFVDFLGLILFQQIKKKNQQKFKFKENCLIEKVNKDLNNMLKQNITYGIICFIQVIQILKNKKNTQEQNNMYMKKFSKAIFHGFQFKELLHFQKKMLKNKKKLMKFMNCKMKQKNYKVICVNQMIILTILILKQKKMKIIDQIYLYLLSFSKYTNKLPIYMYQKILYFFSKQNIFKNKVLLQNNLIRDQNKYIQNKNNKKYNTFLKYNYVIKKQSNMKKLFYIYIIIILIEMKNQKNKKRQKKII
ncbi:MIR domain protein [Ichthyophthirius multifiliis]|uniref:MIR domain protein n=1 Tax=Ichthyophthirius multifiliis TaxID=5932 RepID=G0R2I2_ICHMU|nr:MIR domain protein [Ichthyophthirius multifiliis]EGR28323.1 MIR domain protein [Ichthyophthirius multifiliis]|eukprot:XP_004027668.1 MIR domain protein [Ichthyophthirius multifiliis]